jgi:hypothetical protein
MALRFYPRVHETTTTTGTGDLTLAGAVAQFSSFASRLAVGEPFWYAIVGQTGTEWEEGYGVLSGATTLVRTTSLYSSNADALVSFSAGTKDVFLTIPAFWMNREDTHGMVTAKLTGLAMP